MNKHNDILENEIDLFEQFESLPTHVKEIIEKYSMLDNYQECSDMITELESVGYTCEYYLDAIPFNLRKL